MLLDAEALALSLLAGALARPIPAALARAQWPARSPRAALVLWQAVGLGGGLSVLGAGLTLACADVGSHWLADLRSLPGHRLHLLGWLGVAVTALMGLWLVGVLVASTVRILRTRRIHRRRLDLVSETLDDVQLLEHPVAAAYCLPGLRPRIVLSSAVLTVLDVDEVDAVLCHERAHARGRHDLVVQPFIAWRETFWFARTPARSLAAVERLTEMLADDVARRRCGGIPLVAALNQLSAGQAGADAVALAARVDRLTVGRPPLPRVDELAIYLIAFVLVVGPPIVLLLS